MQDGKWHDALTRLLALFSNCRPQCLPVPLRTCEPCLPCQCICNRVRRILCLCNRGGLLAVAAPNVRNQETRGDRGVNQQAAWACVFEQKIHSLAARRSSRADELQADLLSRLGREQAIALLRWRCRCLD